MAGCPVVPRFSHCGDGDRALGGAARAVTPGGSGRSHPRLRLRGGRHARFCRPRRGTLRRDRPAGRARSIQRSERREAARCPCVDRDRPAAVGPDSVVDRSDWASAGAAHRSGVCGGAGSDPNVAGLLVTPAGPGDSVRPSGARRRRGHRAGLAKLQPTPLRGRAVGGAGMAACRARHRAWMAHAGRSVGPIGPTLDGMGPGISVDTGADGGRLVRWVGLHRLGASTHSLGAGTARGSVRRFWSGGRRRRSR